MAKRKDEKKLPKFDEKQAELLEAAIQRLKDLPDAEQKVALKDALFEEKITDNFEIIYDALTRKGKTKNELIEMWRNENINASLFKFNKIFNALVQKHEKTPVNKYKKEAVSDDKK